MPRQTTAAQQDGLTAKEILFVYHYLENGQNGAQAAISAGYSAKTAKEQACYMLAKPHVKAAVDKQLSKTLRKLEISRERVLQELGLIAFADIGDAFGTDGQLLPLHEMPEEVRRALSGIDVDELFEGRGDDREQIGVTKKIRTWEKTKALELLGKFLKMWTDKVEVSDNRPRVVRRDMTGKGNKGSE